MATPSHKVVHYIEQFADIWLQFVHAAKLWGGGFSRGPIFSRTIIECSLTTCLSNATSPHVCLTQPAHIPVITDKELFVGN